MPGLFGVLLFLARRTPEGQQHPHDVILRHAQQRAHLEIMVIVAQPTVQPDAGIAQRRDGQQHVLRGRRTVFHAKEQALVTLRGPAGRDAGDHGAGALQHAALRVNGRQLGQLGRVVNHHKARALPVIARRGLDPRLHDAPKVVARHRLIQHWPAVAVTACDRVKEIHGPSCR